MKIAISNIAWSASEESDVAALLERRGVRAVEVAPGRIGSAPEALADDAIRRYRELWSERVCGVLPHPG